MADALGDSGEFQISAGIVDASEGTMTTNDGSATLTDNGDGDFTVTFGQAFLSAPYVVATVVDPTFSTLAENSVCIQAVTASTVQFNVILNATNATLTALADVDFHYMAMGKRNR